MASASGAATAAVASASGVAAVVSVGGAAMAAVASASGVVAVVSVGGVASLTTLPVVFFSLTPIADR